MNIRCCAVVVAVVVVAVVVVSGKQVPDAGLYLVIIFIFCHCYRLPAKF